jgi:4-amino-4-deoxy-L-arabinose transferase-like glycosyltransferase
LRLTLKATAGVLGGGLVLLGIRAATLAFGSQIAWAATLRTAAAAMLTAVLSAALAARWLGGRVGLLTGLIYLTTRHVIMPTPAAAADMPLSAAVAAAMAAFALANVPGRLPLIDREATRWAFYTAVGFSVVLSGAVGPLLIFAGCLALLLLTEDRNGLRFLADRGGIALLLLLIAFRLVWAAAWQDVAAQSQCLPGGLSWPWTLRLDVLTALAGAAMPWTPLALATVVLGVWQGHDATAVWRFFACWILGPLLLAVLGVLGQGAVLGALLPPLAAVSAAGLCGLTCWCRHRGRTTWRARGSGCAPNR